MAPQPGRSHPGSRKPNREAIIICFYRPVSPRRGAEQRAVVDPHHEPTGCALAQLSGDLCGSRPLRAPEDEAGFGASLLGTFGQCQKYLAERRNEAVANDSLPSTKPFDKLRACKLRYAKHAPPRLKMSEMPNSLSNSFYAPTTVRRSLQTQLQLSRL